MTVPVIPPMPPAPTRADAPGDWTAKADARVAAETQLVPQINTSVAFVNQRALDADARAVDSAASAAQSAQAAADAALARDAAQSVVGFKGAWSSLAGPLSPPATVLHNDQIWSLLVSLPDITASEPGATTDWLVQGGLDATKIADFTAARNARYWLPASVTVTLPAASGLPTGTFVDLSKAYGATPTICTSDGTLILVNGQSDTSITYNINARLLAVFNGTAWEI